MGIPEFGVLSQAFLWFLTRGRNLSIDVELEFTYSLRPDEAGAQGFFRL